ncbi:hypothetical protein L2E82_40189 [Cichorium intybus]|uniref:Uncharacterized protein n=1 Tax=Cichorium intybus TaxID=13427 RepID=A0ACB9ALA3_CICIN|nr:hypothetical protein L2E82_40189 [Cichorium intybus]
MEIGTVSSLQFDLATIEATTNNFSIENKIGQGGFGSVYKAWKKWIEGRAMELVDPTMVETCSKDEVMRCINIGLLCVQEDVDTRPSMSYVLNTLTNYSITLPSPTRTPHYLPKRHLYFSSSKSVSKSTNESQITEVHAR